MMAALELLEAERTTVQGKLDGAKQQAERNRLGQFATPLPLAKEVLRYGLRLLGSTEQVKFLDPAFGTGSFYSALLAEAERERIHHAAGFEIDPPVADAARRLWKGTSLNLRTADFTRQSPEVLGAKANLLICNPPYVRHHHIPKDDKLRLLDKDEAVAGVRPSGLAGLYCHFLLLSHEWMAPGGVAGWLIPSEFMDVNYGAAIKDYLLEQVNLLAIHRFAPEEVQFDDALVSSAVVWFKREPPSEGKPVHFSFGGTLLEPTQEGAVPREVLRRSPKWTRFPVDMSEPTAGGPRLSDLFVVKRGIATGSNRFFIMDRDVAADKGLPDEFLVPIAPSPRALQTNILEKGGGSDTVETPLRLLSCNLPEAELNGRYPSLKAYFDEGVKEGVADAYLCSHRAPWYAQEHRERPMFLATYMGRAKGGGVPPFRFILNRQGATATNSYLLLYPTPRMQALVAEDEAAVERAWAALNAVPAEEFYRAGRVYGGGLFKVEPKELGRLPAGGILDTIKNGTCSK